MMKILPPESRVMPLLWPNLYKSNTRIWSKKMKTLIIIWGSVLLVFGIAKINQYIVDFFQPYPFIGQIIMQLLLIFFGVWIVIVLKEKDKKQTR